MRRLIVILISGVFLLSGCGTSSTALPGQPSPLPEQSLPTQPPAATREMTMPEPTATMFPTLPVQPTSSLAPTVVPTVVLPPTAAPIATPVPAVPPVKETPMPPSDQGGVPALPPNAQPLNPPFDGALKAQIDQAKQDLAQRLGVDVSTIEVVQVAAVTWPDGALGCPRPGMVYIQVLIDGLFVQLRVGDQLYNYHGDGQNPLFLCDAQFGPQVRIPLPPRTAP
ncbi:MAG: hypothetical protein J7459_14840 [Chloroflexus sp.]|nr:hypothetical protein [Chloroflexus sp.]